MIEKKTEEVQYISLRMPANTFGLIALYALDHPDKAADIFINAGYKILFPSRDTAPIGDYIADSVCDTIAYYSTEESKDA